MADKPLDNEAASPDAMWTFHNLIAHPVCSALRALGLKRAGRWLHDATVPPSIQEVRAQAFREATEEMTMQVRRIDKTPTFAALYDGELIGDPDGEDKVIPRTAPDWFPALAREWDGKTPTLDVEVGELIVKPDRTLVYVAPGAFIEVRPGDWIVKRGDLIQSMSSALFRSAYEAASLHPNDKRDETMSEMKL